MLSHQKGRPKTKAWLAEKNQLEETQGPAQGLHMGQPMELLKWQDLHEHTICHLFAHAATFGLFFASGCRTYSYHEFLGFYMSEVATPEQQVVSLLFRKNGTVQQGCFYFKEDRRTFLHVQKNYSQVKFRQKKIKANKY